jgi:molybdopterin-guanine dinucleotide biosynthesis protein A
MDAIVLAGGKADDPLARRFGVANKTLVPFRGRPLVEYTLEALHRSGLEVILVGPEARLNPPPRQRIADQGSMLGNLEAALALAQSQKVLVATADMPFLGPESVRWILGQAPLAGLVYTAIPKPVVEQRFAGMRRTYARTKEGQFTGGNIVLLDKTLFAQALPVIRKAIALRKQPLALAGMIGWGVLLKTLLGQISIPELEARISKLLGMSACALITPYAEVGVDLDREEDLKWLDATGSG